MKILSYLILPFLTLIVIVDSSIITIFGALLSGITRLILPSFFVAGIFVWFGIFYLWEYFLGQNLSLLIITICFLIRFMYYISQRKNFVGVTQTNILSSLWGILVGGGINLISNFKWF